MEIYKMSEHGFQYQVVELLAWNKIVSIECDVMSGLQYFSHLDPRRFAFINHHKKMGYRKGQIDLIVITKPFIYFVELKTSKGKHSKEQKEFQKLIENLDKKYLLWKNLDEVKEFIKEVKK